MATRNDAQDRADDIRVFRRELARLRQEGALVLAAAEEQRVARHHDQLLAGFAQSFDIDRSAQAKRLSVGMRVASLLGALALAASVYFLFHQFWGLLPDAAQAAVLIGTALGTLVLTLWVRNRDASGYFTNLCAMVAFASFVIDLALLGRTFNVAPADHALLAWAALAFLLAYRCDSRLLLAAGMVCLAGYVAARAGAWRGIYWLDLGQRPEDFLPAAVLLFLVPAVVDHRRFPGFASAYRVGALLALFLPVLVLAFRGQASYLDVDAGLIEALYQIAGFALCAAVAWLGVRREWPAVANTGITFFVVFLYTKFFDWWWAWMPKYLFFLVLGLVAVLVLLVLRRLRRTVPAAGEAEGAR